MASRGATLVLRTSWFNHSSWILAKEIIVVRVYGYRAFTSPRISSFRPSIKVHKSYFSNQSIVWLDKYSNLIWYSCSIKLGWKVEARVTAIVGITWEDGGSRDGYRVARMQL
ncbi:hypothetical protein BHE74_00024982 [Ensete ventricosum]|nr:hypothetical protein BHE74_00024982 [Ensete ventricosum]